MNIFFLSRKSQQSKQYLRVLSQKCTNFKNGNFENVARSSKTIFSFLSAVIMLKLVRNVIKLDVVNKFANNFVNFRKKVKGNLTNFLKHIFEYINFTGF